MSDLDVLISDLMRVINNPNIPHEERKKAKTLLYTVLSEMEGEAIDE